VPPCGLVQLFVFKAAIGKRYLQLRWLTLNGCVQLEKQHAMR